MANFQREVSSSNTQVGIDFERHARRALARSGVNVEPHFDVRVVVGDVKKTHSFDLGSASPPLLVECKSHRWTTGGNVPSAKLTVWNEAMYYFAIAPVGYRRIFFVLRDFSEKRGLTLAEYYLGRYRHLVPDGVEFWELDENTDTCREMPIGV